MSHTFGLPFALGTMFPRETGVVRREALRGALVPDPFDESVTDGSRDLPMVFFVHRGCLIQLHHVSVILY